MPSGQGTGTLGKCPRCGERRVAVLFDAFQAAGALFGPLLKEHQFRIRGERAHCDAGIQRALRGALWANHTHFALAMSRERVPMVRQLAQRLMGSVFGSVSYPELTSTQVRRIRRVVSKQAGRVTCSIGALARVVWRCARIHRRSLALVALLCTTLATGKSGGDTPGSLGMTRVMIVDDQSLLRRGLKDLLLSFPDFVVVAEASSGDEALRLFEQVRPDITLMDLVMPPGMDGIAAMRSILEIAPDAKIIVVSEYQEGDVVREAIEAGAFGYHLKSNEDDELVKAIRQAIRGIPSLAPAAAQALVRLTSRSRKFGDNLTDRERAVLDLLAQGLKNLQIGDRLAITEATVKFHLRNIQAKLGTKNRIETVLAALEHRLSHRT
jgi:NarL family two-component system response regulator LiaR